MRSKKYQELEKTGEIEIAEIKGLGETEEILAEETQEPKDPKEKSWAREWLRDIVIAVVIALIVMQFIKPTIVKQRSMEPNFHTNDYLLVSKQSYGLFNNKPELGDVIIFETEMKTEDGDDKLLIKRVIGVPGDVVSISNGDVYVNGEIIDDSYTKDGYTSGDIDSLVIPEGHLFCLGDNRAVSVDSRSDEVGLISLDDVIGKAVFRIYPFSDFGRIKNPYS